jgi:hypothetical protein
MVVRAYTWLMATLEPLAETMKTLGKTGSAVGSGSAGGPSVDGKPRILRSRMTKSWGCGGQLVGKRWQGSREMIVVGWD